MSVVPYVCMLACACDEHCANTNYGMACVGCGAAVTALTAVIRAALPARLPWLPRQRQMAKMCDLAREKRDPTINTEGGDMVLNSGAHRPALLAIRLWSSDSVGTCAH